MTEPVAARTTAPPPGAAVAPPDAAVGPADGTVGPPDGAVERRRALQADPVAQLERLVEIRRFEDRVQLLFRQGALFGSTHLCNGQEAVAVGIARALRPTDHVTCTYRGHGVALALGMTPEAVLGEIMGREVGCLGGRGGSMHLSDSSIGLLPTFAIVGAGIPVAAGAALSAQVLGEDRVALAVFGDGATNIGAFHEALNLAAVWRLPVVFACENNHFGEYSRIDLTTPFEGLARRAHAYDIPAAVADGQDVDAVADAVGSAVAAARDGGGPRFVELKTYRYAGHSRSDAAPYRDPAELERWLARDPIDLFERRLLARGVLTPAGAQELRARVDERLGRAEETVRSSPEPALAAMFADVDAGSPRLRAPAAGSSSP